MGRSWGKADLVVGRGLNNVFRFAKGLNVLLELTFECFLLSGFFRGGILSDYRIRLVCGE